MRLALEATAFTERGIMSFFECGKNQVGNALFKTQQSFYKIHVGLGYHAVFVESTFAFFGFFCKNVSFKRLLMGDFSSSRHFEALLGTRVRFNLRHKVSVVE